MAFTCPLTWNMVTKEVSGLIASYTQTSRHFTDNSSSCKRTKFKVYYRS